MAGLGGAEAVVAELFRLRRETPRLAEIVREKAAVDLHGGPLLEPRRRGQASGHGRLVGGATSMVAPRAWTPPTRTAGRSPRSGCGERGRSTSSASERAASFWS